jgi:hypothetical protein
MTEQELLLIAETKKEFCNILLGQQITFHADHQNLTYKNFNTEHVMRWHSIQIIKGPKNIVADILSHLDILPYEESLEQHGRLLWS